MKTQNHFKSSWILFVVFLLFLFIHVSVIASVSSTSPYVPNDDPNQMQIMQMLQGQESLITFSEFPLNTYITNHYADYGILFGGDNPYITLDGANPTSPVLSGSPQFQGNIEGYFVDPTDGITPKTVTWFSLDAGYFDEIETTRLEWFDLVGNKLGEVLNSSTGIETFAIEGGHIFRWRISKRTTDPAGFAIDNLNFEISPFHRFEKDDDLDDANDLDCRNPGQELEYTICWDNTDGVIIDDAFIIDWLPEGVTYPGGEWQILFDPNIVLIPPDPGYDPNTHSYRWDLGTIDPNTWGCVDLTVVVNNLAQPGRYLLNVAEMYGTVYDANNIPDEVLIAWAVKGTLVCCWDTDGILYVDRNATGSETGLSWADAYTDLQDALTRARETHCAIDYVIYVAQGTYCPGDSEEDTFDIPEGVFVYGGFKTGGCDFSERNPKKYETILTGLFDEDAFPDVDTVVTMQDDTRLDGFTITACRENAIYGDGADFVLENNVIKDSFRYGIYAKDGNVAVKWCMVNMNEADGIRHEGEGFTLSVDNSWILRNGEYGIYCEGSTPTVKNSIVSESDLTEQGREGIRLIKPTYSPILYNITISNNKAAGIFFEDDVDICGDPNNRDWPDLQNCIVYYNNGGQKQLAGFDADNIASYCCIQDCNEVNYNYNDAPGFAYTIDPEGAPDPENYHLAYDAFCKDKASSSLSYAGQVDMDGEGDDRKYGSSVDIGADEVYSCDEPLTDDDVYNALDWNANGVVNYEEFSAFSAAWLSRDPWEFGDPNLADPNEYANWNPLCNLDQTGDSEHKIDLADLEVFISDTPWLWVACWKLEELAETMMMGGGGESMMRMSTSFSESVYEEEENAYASMSDPQLALFVKGIYEVMDQLEIMIDQDPENEENASELKGFLEGVLLDIKESRQ